MTSRPVDAFALTAPIESIMGFPDIIGHQAMNVILIDRADGNVAVNASGKRPDIVPANADLTHDLFELLNETVGCDEDVMMVPPHFMNFPTSGNQYPIILQPGVEFVAGSCRFVYSVISQDAEPFGQGSQGFVNSKTVVHNNLGIQGSPNLEIQGFRNFPI